MCDPLTALTVASTAVSTMGELQQGQQQKAYAKRKGAAT